MRILAIIFLCAAINGQSLRGDDNNEPFYKIWYKKLFKLEVKDKAISANVAGLGIQVPRNHIEWLLWAVYQKIAGDTQYQLNQEFLEAIYEGNLVRAQLLLDRGAHIDAQDFYGDRALHLAVILQNEEAIKWLQSKGADLAAKNNYGEQPRDLARKLNRQRALEVLTNSGSISAPIPPIAQPVKQLNDAQTAFSSIVESTDSAIAHVDSQKLSEELIIYNEVEVIDIRSSKFFPRFPDFKKFILDNDLVKIINKHGIHIRAGGGGLPTFIFKNGHRTSWLFIKPAVVGPGGKLKPGIILNEIGFVYEATGKRVPLH